MGWREIYWNRSNDNRYTRAILRPGAPFKTDLVQPGTKGEIMHFSGTVFGKDGKALKSALVEIWHCDENGVYDNTSDAYVYRSSFKTGADGKYNFKSIYPVPYAASATLNKACTYSYENFCCWRARPGNTSLFQRR